jgi:hypothetical protein
MPLNVGTVGGRLAGGPAKMAAMNKCLAQSNKSSTCSTEHMSGDPADKGRAQQQGEA